MTFFFMFRGRTGAVGPITYVTGAFQINPLVSTTTNPSVKTFDPPNPK